MKSYTFFGKAIEESPMARVRRGLGVGCALDAAIGHPVLLRQDPVSSDMRDFLIMRGMLRAKRGVIRELKIPPARLV